MRVRLALAIATALAATATAPGAQAQSLDAGLELAQPFLTGEASDGIAYAYVAKLAAPWTLTFPNAAIAARELAPGNGTISWTLDCLGFITLTSNDPIALEFAAGEEVYEGTMELPIEAKPEASNAPSIPCLVNATFSGASTRSEDSAMTEIPVEYRGAIAMTVDASSRKAGPQKQISYPLEVTNHGHIRTFVQFDLVGDKPKDGWQVVLPETVVLDPGGTVTAVVSVSTPYKNGYVTGGTNFTVRATPSPFDDPERDGTSVSVPLHAGVEGAYVPGPALPLLALALGLAAVARVRRRD